MNSANCQVSQLGKLSELFQMYKLSKLHVQSLQTCNNYNLLHCSWSNSCTSLTHATPRTKAGKMATETNSWSLARSYRFCTTVPTNTRLTRFLGRCKTKVKQSKHTHTQTGGTVFTGQPVRDHEEHAVTQQGNVLTSLRVQSKNKTKQQQQQQQKNSPIKQQPNWLQTTAELITLSVHNEQVSLVFDRRVDNERKKKKKKKKRRKKMEVVHRELLRPGLITKGSASGRHSIRLLYDYLSTIGRIVENKTRVLRLSVIRHIDDVQHERKSTNCSLPVSYTHLTLPTRRWV